MGIDLSGTAPADPSRPQGILEMIHDGIGGIGAALVNGIGGLFGGVVAGLQGLAGMIGSLFSAGRRDTAAVDQARADGERAIVANMSASLEHLDEIQRAGGAYMDVPTFRFDNGENWSHVLPLTKALPLASGTSWIPPHAPLTHSTGHRYPGATASQRNASRAAFAAGSGQLELLESGLWIIQFQASVLQGSAFGGRPVDVWCHVTAADSPWIPTGPPGAWRDGGSNPGLQLFDHREGLEWEFRPESEVAAFGRASSYIGTRDSQFSGGNSVSGVVMAVLGTGAWKVTLSCNSWEKFTGPMSTYVYATKVNSETLRQDIDQLKDAIADSLPGQNVDKLLDEAAIQSMVDQAAEIEVPEVEVPDEP